MVEEKTNNEKGENTIPHPAKPLQNQTDNENIWLNLGLNIIIPSIILMKGGRWSYLHPSIILIIALLFPLSYGIYDFFFRHKYNFFSILSFASILLTGGVGLMKLDKDWIAIKEAAIPSIIGLAILLSLKTPYPLIRVLLYNEKVINIVRVEIALNEQETQSSFAKLLFNTTLLLSSSFLLSAILNFTLAKFLIHSESGTNAFNEELGRMTFWSWPVIVLPCMFITALALWKLLSGIKKLTGLKLEEVFRNFPEETKAQS